MPGSADSQFSNLLGEGINDPAIRSMVGSLLDGAAVALRDLSSLDEAIFTRLVDSGAKLYTQDPATLFPQLFASTFSGVRKLLAYAEHSWLLGAGAAAEPEGDLDFDFPMEEAPGGRGTARSDARLALNDVDIEGVLDSIAPAAPADEFGQFAQLRSHVAAIDYGLKAQMDGFKARLEEALSRGNYNELMGELDDARNAASDGIYALVTAVCQTFLPTVEAGSLLPEYRSQLQRALLVRWSLSHLAREVAHDNALIQRRDVPPAEADAALLRLVQTLERFTKGQAFRAMRPTDRWEMNNFQRLLAGKKLAESRQTCEGLDKYLESLGSINQREVLIQHDNEVIKEVRELLEAAQSLLAISPAGAGSLVRQGLQTSGKLYGRNRELDQLLTQVGLTPPALHNAAAVEPYIQRLRDALR